MKPRYGITMPDEVPMKMQERVIDGMDMSDFFRGKQKKSGREGAG